MIEPIHKQAILKLINCFTISPPLSLPEYGDGGNLSPEPSLYKFTDPIPSIDLPALSRLAVVILKFEKVFKHNPVIANGSQFANLKQFNSANHIYLQEMPALVNHIEGTNLFGTKNDYANALETIQQLQSSQHLQALILFIRDWLCQFYIQKDIIYSLFPVVNNTENVFSIIDIKENNICILSLLIFNVFYKLRDSFPEYKMLLDFSWIILTGLERFVDMVNINNEYLLGLVETSLLCARLEDEQDATVNANLHKQIETLRARIVETKKRIQTLAISKTNQVNSNVNVADHHGQKVMRITSSSSRPATSASKTASNNSKSNNRLDTKPFKCGACPKTFPTSYKLNRHAYSHSGERPYMCTWSNCQKRFNDNYHLRRHMNTHTGEKPFPCKFPGCTKRYSRSEDLRNHQKTHYGNISLAESAAIINNGSGMHHDNDDQKFDANNLNVLVQSTPNSVSSPVSFALTSSAISSLTGSKSTIRLADHNSNDQSQLVLQSQLNQLQQQLQLQSQQQQQTNQQQQQNFASALSPHQVIEDATLQPTILLQDSTANANQNHVTNSLHMNENYF